MTLTTACMSTPMPRTDPTKPLQKRCEDGQNGHPQTVRLSDHINSSVASLLYALCYTLRRACVSLSYDPCDASLLQHLGCSSFFLFFLDFFPNTRNTRGVTKGFLVGEHQQSHYAKYEYPPDDSIHVLPGGRHTWSTVRRRRTPSHLRDLNSINRRDSAARRSTGSPLAMFASAVSDGVGATMGVQGSPLAMFASAVSDGVGATMGAWDTCFEGPPPAMLASAVRWREDTACVESFYQSKVLGFSLLVVA